MNERFFRIIAELIVERNNNILNAYAIIEDDDVIVNHLVTLYKDIYTALLVQDRFITNLLEHHPLEVDELVSTAFFNNIEALEDLLMFINEEEDNKGHEAEVLGMNISIRFMNEDHGFSKHSLVDHISYMIQFMILVRSCCDDIPRINYSEEEINAALDIYLIVKEHYVEDMHVNEHQLTKSLFVTAIATYIAESQDPYFDACKAALLIALNKETIIERFNIDNTDISIGSDAASAVIDNKHQLHSIIEFYSNKPVLLYSTAIQIISLLRSKYENFITDTHDLKLSDLCILLEIMLAIVDYVSTVDSILIDNLRNSLSHTNEYDILCQHISALQNK
jgi:hypothetical protein